MSAQIKSNGSAGGEAFEIWGLTGGIGAGKSTAASFFAAAGFIVIDADEIARDLRQENGAAHPPIIKRFGTLDRERLREIIFKDPAAKKDLEAILHPLIRLESHRRMTALSQAHPQAPRGKSGKPCVIYEAALLVESRSKDQNFAGLIVVEAPRESRLDRLTQGRGVGPALAATILESQATDEERRKVATHVLINNGSQEKLRQQVQTLAPKLKA